MCFFKIYLLYGIDKYDPHRKNKFRYRKHSTKFALSYLDQGES